MTVATAIITITLILALTPTPTLTLNLNLNLTLTLTLTLTQRTSAGVRPSRADEETFRSYLQTLTGDPLID